MKPKVFCFCLFTLLTCACNKNRKEVCVSQIESDIDHLASANELDKIEHFMAGIQTLGEYQITSVTEETSVLFSIGTYQLYRAMPVLSGIPVNNHLVFINIGKDSSLSTFNDYRESLDSSGIPEIPVVDFQTAAETAHEYMDWKKCYTAEKVVYNVNHDNLGNYPPRWELVWKIKPENAEYMYVFVSTETGEVVYFEDGVW